MKIHQIVSEADPISAIKTGWNAYKAARSAVPAAATAAQKAATAAAKKAQAIKDLAAAGKPSKAAIDAAKATTSTTKGAAQVDVAKTASWWETEAAKIAAKGSAKADALAAGALKSTVLASKADTIVRTLYAVDMIKEATVYWVKSTEIENDPSLTDEQKIDAIRQLRGELIVSVIAPKVGAWGISKLAFPLKVIPWLTKISGSPNAAEIMKHLSKRGTEAALIAWFGVGDGKEWLKNTFGFLITGVGSAPELIGKVYDVTKAAVQVASGNLPSGYKPSDEIDLNDPASVMNKVGDMMGGGGNGNYVDPFKGTGRGGK